MALTANRELRFFTSQELIEVGVDANANVYKGALVGRNRTTGFARPLVGNDDFLGVAYKQADNTFAGNVAGGTLVKLHQRIDIIHALTGVAQGDVGKDVYASADDTLTLTPTNSSRIGRVVGVEGTNTARVRCQPVTMLNGVLEGLPVRTLPDADTSLGLDHMNRVLTIANTAVRTITLPPVATVRAGGWIRVVKTNAAAFAVVLDGNGAETIDGAATLGTVDAIYDVAFLVCTGSEWIVLSRDIS